MVRCDLCGRVEDRERAIEEGWCPDYWVTQTIRRAEPVCPGLCPRGGSLINQAKGAAP